MGGQFRCLMMAKFFKEFIMIHSPVGLAMSFKLMEILLSGLLKKEPKVEMAAIIGLVQGKCILGIGLEDYLMAKVNI